MQIRCRGADAKPARGLRGLFLRAHVHTIVADLPVRMARVRAAQDDKPVIFFNRRVIDGWETAAFVPRLKTLHETPALSFVGE